MKYFMAILGNECRLTDEFDSVMLFTTHDLAEAAARDEWGVDAMPYVTIEDCTIYA